MKRILFIILTMAAGLCLNAQEIANIGKKINVISPEINGNQVTFRLEAPDAQSVQVNGTMNEEYTIINIYGGEARACRPADMVKNDKGIWEYTCTVSPDWYNYCFIVDGVPTLDPANPLMQRDGHDRLNAFLVKGEYSKNYAEANERGNLHFVWYDSPSLNSNRRMVIYTPYGYEENTDQRYPVLYLFHGGMRDEEQWSDLGLVRQILDNRIEKGEAVPMIVVMPNIDPNYQAVDFLMLPGYEYEYKDKLSFGQGFLESLKEDIIPYVESHYRVIPDKAHRAVSGFSMGGGTTINAALTYPELFDYMMPMASGMGRSQENIDRLLRFKEAGYKLIWIGCGDDDTAFDGAKSMDELLTELDMPHTFYVTPGGHAWYNCRHYLNTYAPLLFRD